VIARSTEARPQGEQARPLDPHPTAAGEHVYREHIVRIHRLMYAKVGNRPDAEDLTSETFARALLHLRRDASPGEIHRYLTLTARSVLADHWRRRFGVQLTTLDEEVVSRDGAAVDETVAARRLRRVQRVLAGLPPGQRSVLELRFLSGCSIREVAARMGISVGNARVLQHRALREAALLAGRV
jgi:RNA polymerase sigma-70 factor, ECF subfamily